VAFSGLKFGSFEVKSVLLVSVYWDYNLQFWAVILEQYCCF
jgi:hypothetical protein